MESGSVNGHSFRSAWVPSKQTPLHYDLHRFGYINSTAVQNDLVRAESSVCIKLRSGEQFPPKKYPSKSMVVQCCSLHCWIRPCAFARWPKSDLNMSGGCRPSNGSTDLVKRPGIKCHRPSRWQCQGLKKCTTRKDAPNQPPEVAPFNFYKVCLKSDVLGHYFDGPNLNAGCHESLCRKWSPEVSINWRRIDSIRT